MNQSWQNLKRGILVVLTLLVTVFAFVQNVSADDSGSQNQQIKIQKLPLVSLNWAKANSHIYSRARDYYKIVSSSVELIAQEEITGPKIRFFDYQNDCSSSNGGLDVGIKPSPGAKPGNGGFRDGNPPVGTSPISVGLGETNIILDQIINIGSKIWDLVKKSRPVVNVRSVTANALPKGLQCWDQLEYWQAPRSEVYRAAYKNAFGYEVMRMDVRVIHAYGGRLQGRGRYITNAAVQYRDLRVAPGMFELNANVEVPLVMNVGSSLDPVAALQMNLNWMVRGVNEIQQSVSFVVFGDGRKTEVHN